MRPALVVRRAADHLSRHDVEAPLPTAEILMASVLGTDRVGVYARDDGLSTSEAKRFGRALCQRCVGVLVAAPDRRSAVPPAHVRRPARVFIPVRRPSPRRTRARGRQRRGGAGRRRRRDRDRCDRAHDEGRAPRCPGPAIDLSSEAVELARENATRSELDVEVVQGDLLDPVPAVLRGSIDLVVSNPPYVEPHELASLPREVLADPLLALAGGIEVYERLFAQAAQVLRPGGAIVVEIGESQGSRACAAATAAGFVSVEVEPDLNDRDRIVTARMPA